MLLCRSYSLTWLTNLFLDFTTDSGEARIPAASYQFFPESNGCFFLVETYRCLFTVKIGILHHTDRMRVREGAASVGTAIKNIEELFFIAVYVTIGTNVKKTIMSLCIESNPGNLPSVFGMIVDTVKRVGIAHAFIVLQKWVWGKRNQSRFSSFSSFFFFSSIRFFVSGKKYPIIIKRIITSANVSIVVFSSIF